MSEDFAKRVAARIRALREARGLSLRELSRRSGVAPESVSRSERGVTDVTLPNLAKIAAGLGVDLPEFFSFDAAPDWSSAALDGDLRHVVETLRRATPELRARLVLAIDLVAGVEIPELTQRALDRASIPPSSSAQPAPSGQKKQPRPAKG